MTAFVVKGGPTEVAQLSAGALIPAGADRLPQPNDAHGGVGDDHPARELLPLGDLDAVLDVQNLTKAVEVGEELARKSEELARKNRDGAAGLPGQALRPTTGILTSSYGARWGTTHYGLDIANKIGTPIRAAADGVVAEAGPASGFGMWVRIKHPDGSTTIYGHINRALVQAGQRVKAGQLIAEMGNRGYSTGPHLHFEVWDAAGNKINPKSWLAARGVQY